MLDFQKSSEGHPLTVFLGNRCIFPIGQGRYKRGCLGTFQIIHFLVAETNNGQGTSNIQGGDYLGLCLDQRNVIIDRQEVRNQSVEWINLSRREVKKLGKLSSSINLEKGSFQSWRGVVPQTIERYVSRQLLQRYRPTLATCETLSDRNGKVKLLMTVRLPTVASIPTSPEFA